MISLCRVILEWFSEFYAVYIASDELSNSCINIVIAVMNLLGFLRDLC